MSSIVYQKSIRAGARKKSTSCKKSRQKCPNGKLKTSRVSKSGKSSTCCKKKKKRKKSLSAGGRKKKAKKCSGKKKSACRSSKKCSYKKGRGCKNRKLSAGASLSGGKGRKKKAKKCSGKKKSACRSSKKCSYKKGRGCKNRKLSAGASLSGGKDKKKSAKKRGPKDGPNVPRRCKKIECKWGKLKSPPRGKCCKTHLMGTSMRKYNAAIKKWNAGRASRKKSSLSAGASLSGGKGRKKKKCSGRKCKNGRLKSPVKGRCCKKKKSLSAGASKLSAGGRKKKGRKKSKLPKRCRKVSCKNGKLKSPPKGKCCKKKSKQ
jgi:hypothetical protein